jgi:hypothetical protein
MFEHIKLTIRQHSNEIVIFGIMAALSVGIAFLATGDLSQSVEAGRRR